MHKTVFLFCLVLGQSSQIYATPSQKPNSSIKTQLAPYNTYLRHIKSLKAHITQTDHKNRSAEGTLYIQKPGRLRLVYEPKGTLELVADGQRLIQYDGRTQESDSMSLSNSPLGFLLRANGNLQDHANVLEIIPGPRHTQIVLNSKEDPEGGTIKLVFQNYPLELVKWIIIDPDGHKTRVGLSQIKKNISIGASTFRTKRTRR